MELKKSSDLENTVMEKKAALDEDALQSMRERKDNIEQENDSDGDS